MTRPHSLKWLPGVALALALTTGSLPAMALEPVEAAALQPAPEVSPATVAEDPVEPGGAVDPSSVPLQEVPAPQDPAASPPPEPSPAQAPLPPATPMETGPTDPPAEGTTDWLEELIGPLGAKMGQGLERLEESGDAQVATQEEVALEAEVERLADEGGMPVASGGFKTPAFGPSSLNSAASPVSGGPSSIPVISRAADIKLASTWQPPGIQGIDVSSHQLNVDWRSAWNKGSRFAYVKATEATSYKNPYYNQQYNGSADVGMYRGAYHFAIPNVSSGASQANYFVNNGGGWSADGRTLPPLLDIEYNPYAELGNTCYNMSAAQMVNWIRDFSNTVKARTGRVPMIYSTTDWWNTCTGSSTAFADHPLHIANYNKVGAGKMPAGWKTYNVWQYSSTGPFVGDSNVFNGNATQLHQFALRTDDFVVETDHPIGAAWLAAGGAAGTWGSPTSNQTCFPAYCTQTFDRTTAYWTSSQGTVRTVYTPGAIGQAWKASGALIGASSWGIPSTNETCYPTYCTQTFERAVAYWSANQGVTTATLPKPIGKAWSAAGGIGGASSWGIPSTNETCYPTYCTQTFERAVAYWSANQGVTTATLPKPIGKAWSAAGGIGGASSWGIPSTNETCYPTYCTQTFERAVAYWSANQGVTTATLPKPIGKAWSAAGGIGGASSWGIPSTNETCYPTYCTQTFERAVAYWSPNLDVSSVNLLGPIGKAWTASGRIHGSWGMSTGNQTCSGTTSCTQQFERVTAIWTASAGVRITQRKA
ncbi:hypothetical protein J2M54_13820 [Arthrobacter sp. zg-ZUI227]|uniref:GH25 family lysozyme n=1 Tax=Arthrobacter jiangjiafuii TaxID=2817475 RepID=UPI001AEEEB87|nr:GH25 family lysozyme [Arthrobacter jiangjiafuii]MBP3044624.1 hypothetical protein [Arthrobacter jiangjiafuii]